MGLQRFERRLERLVEGGFGKAFRSGLQPVEIGRRLVREMDVHRALGLRGTVVPNRFVVHLSADDLARFAGFHAALADELAEVVRDHARESDYHFVGPVDIALEVDGHARTGDLSVDAEIREGERGAAGAVVLPDGRRIQVGEEAVVVGRMPECDIALSDSQVSRRHAEIRRAGHGVEVVDLGSLNGTTVNGASIREHVLSDGDEIGIGETVLRYEES